MRQWVLLAVIIIFSAVSCADNPAPQKETAEPQITQPAPDAVQSPEPQPVPEPQPAAEPSAAPSVLPAAELPAPEPELLQENGYVVTQEEFDTTKADIQKLIQDLNRIIRAGNYNVWLTYLSEDYKSSINSKEFLDDIKTRYPVFRTRINNARDYFNNVVVPSRANDRVDDIEFLSKNDVVAYTVDNNNRRLVLYHLENTDGKWKIAN